MTLQHPATAGGAERHAQDTWLAVFVKTLTRGLAQSPRKISENSPGVEIARWHVGCSIGSTTGARVHPVQRRQFEMSDQTGTSIRELRRNLRMTQEEFAHTLGITVATVNRWENGHAKPSKLARRAIDRLVQYRQAASSASA